MEQRATRLAHKVAGSPRNYHRPNVPDLDSLQPRACSFQHTSKPSLHTEMAKGPQRQYTYGMICSYGADAQLHVALEVCVITELARLNNGEHGRLQTSSKGDAFLQLGFEGPPERVGLQLLSLHHAFPFEPRFPEIRRIAPTGRRMLRAISLCKGATGFGR